MSPDSRARFVVVGASNVSRALRPIVEIARARAAEPLEILTAHGHGRSYGTWSRVLWVRELPSIESCGLWHALEARAAPRTEAWVTDIGNDLVYGADPATIAGWVEIVFDRLAAARARVVVTAVPIASLERLGRLRFELARRILFPGRPMTLAHVIARARELDVLVTRAAARRGFALVTPRAEWYGVDPIHVRWRARESVFAEIADALRPATDAADRVHATPRALERDEGRALSRLRPAHRRWLGREQRAAQPGVVWHDGTSVSWY